MTRLFADPFLVTAFPLPSFFRRLSSPSLDSPTLDPPSVVSPKIVRLSGVGATTAASSSDRARIRNAARLPLRQVPYREITAPKAAASPATLPSSHHARALRR